VHILVPEAHEGVRRGTFCPARPPHRTGTGSFEAKWVDLTRLPISSVRGYAPAPSRGVGLHRKEALVFTLDLDKLTAEQRSMVALWEAHLKAELQDKDAHASCDTMVANPYVNHVAVLTGGSGRRQLANYYSRYFIPGQPPDLEIVPISRTV